MPPVDPRIKRGCLTQLKETVRRATQAVAMSCMFNDDVFAAIAIQSFHDDPPLWCIATHCSDETCEKHAVIVEGRRIISSPHIMQVEFQFIWGYRDGRLKHWKLSTPPVRAANSQSKTTWDVCRGHPMLKHAWRFRDALL